MGVLAVGLLCKKKGVVISRMSQGGRYGRKLLKKTLSIEQCNSTTAKGKPEMSIESNQRFNLHEISIN